MGKTNREPMDLGTAIHIIIESYVQDSDTYLPRIDMPIYPRGFFDPESFVEATLTLIAKRKEIRDGRS